MKYKVRTRDEHLTNDRQPKRILALDGGGLRGILTLAILQKIEDVLRERHGSGKDFRLSHYFDLIAGTSTGAIIAATLSLGKSVEEIRAMYMSLGKKVFQKGLLREGLFRAKYDKARLIDELKGVYGADTKLGSSALQTGFMAVTKRLDTGSWWPISNNPRGKYFDARSGGVIGNCDYPLWQVVRASTAAPAYFDPEDIEIAKAEDGTIVSGNFVDGGMSPFNNPSMLAVMYATMDGYRIGWPSGAENLLVVSVGTGRADPKVKRANLPAENAIKSLLALMEDAGTLQETLLQWMSSSPTARSIDRELDDLQHDLVAGKPVISYLRYNVDLAASAVHALNPGIDQGKIESLTAMDAPENMDTLHELGRLTAERDVHGNDFPSAFDLPLS